MEVPLMQFPPGDPRVVDKIASQLKSQGIFDQFRKECISDVDTKPAYQNLHQRVEGTVASFLASQEWRPDLNKNQLRDSLRKHIHESGFLDIGVERIVDQVVNPKIMTVFLPQIEDVVYKCLGLEKPKKGKENQMGFAKQPSANVPQKIITLKDLLPTDLDPISPESDGIKDKDELSEDEKEFESANNEEEEEEMEEEEEEGGGEEDEEEEEEEEEEELKAVDEEEVSPPFEPIEEINSQCDESSMDSRLSGISDLTSHDSQTSNASFGGNVQVTNAKIPVIDLANHDSQLSKVSSGSRLSIVLSDDQEKLALKPPSSPPEIDIVNDESQLSKSSLQILSQESQASDNIEMSNQGSEESKATESIIVKDSSSDTSNVDTKSSSKSPNIILCENDQSKVTCLDDAGDTNSSKTDSEEKSIETEKVEKKYIIEKEDREKLLDTRDEKKRSRTVFESGDLKKNEHERKQNDKYRRDRGESKRSSRHDDRDRSDEKSKRDGGKGKESERDIKKDRIRSDSKIVKEKMKLEERDEMRDKPKYAERFEIVVHKNNNKNRTKNFVDSEKDESTDLGDKVSQDYEDDFERNGDKVKSDDLFGDDEFKHDDNLEMEGNRKTSKSRHRSKYEDKKERERNKERESGKSKGRHDDRLNKDGSKEKSHNEDKFDRDSAKDREDKLKSDKDKIEKDGKERSRHESRSERDFSKEKSKYEERIEKDGSKDKQKTEDKVDKSRQDRSKHSDKGEKDSNRNRTKHDAKQEKERRSDDRSKASFDKLNKEKKEDASKTDEVDGDKREKSRSEVRKDKTGREKSKHEDRGRSKTDSKHHKDSTKAEVKEDGSSRNEKSNRDRSGNRDSKTKSKSDGKENENRREEKGTKDRTKTDERNGRDKSSKSQSKGKENHEKKVDRKKDDSDSGKSSRSGDNKGKDAKKKDGKSKSVVDDHHIHRDKNTDDRRSTDRDSSGTQRSRTVSSRRSGSDTRSSHRHDKRDSNGSSGNNKSDGGGNSESAAELPEDSSDQASMEMPVSPPASLPFKKRPVQNQTADTDSREEYSCTINAGKLILKSKKPKIAANIFEARKIMHLRKSMAKFERKKQKRWRKDQSSKRNAERRSDSDQENDIPPDSLSLEVTSKKEGSESDEEPLLFFREEEAHVDEDFIQFVKKLEESETLSQISWESSNESDNEIQSQLEINVAVNVVDSKEDGGPNMNSYKFIESKDDLPSLTVAGNYAFDNANEPLPETDEPFLNSSIINNLEDTLPTTNESVFSNSSSDIKSTHNRRSRNKYEFSENISHRVLSRQTSKAPESETEINETALTVINTKVVQDIGGIVQNSSSRVVRTNNGNSKSSISKREPVCNQSLDKFDDINSDYTVSNDYGHSVSSDVIEVPSETSPAPNLDYAISVDSTDDDNDDDDDSDDEPVHITTVHINDLDVDRNDYSYIGDNNNVDKSSSDDEKCGDGMSLSKELILPALRDLILESGFQLGDDLEATECLAAGSGMPTPDSQGEMSEKQSSAGSGSSVSNASEKKRPKLGRSRRVGLGKPHPSKRLDVGKRVATPPAVAADFVMPLSPESDVSASSVEQIRKGPADVQADASSLSEVAETTNFAHLDSDSEERRHLRSSSAGTPARHDQVNNNEDLFKPRPLFGQRKHGQFSSTQVEEPVVNCVGKRRRSTIESDGPQTSKRMRR